jgi:hypothetical protein
MGLGAPNVRQVSVTVFPSTVRALAAGAVVISGGRAEMGHKILTAV